MPIVKLFTFMFGLNSTTIAAGFNTGTVLKSAVCLVEIRGIAGKTVNHHAEENHVAIFIKSANLATGNWSFLLQGRVLQV